MCGILGLIFDRPSQFDPAALLSELTHRGPDDHGLMYWDGESFSFNETPLNPSKVILGHKRLSIIDTSSAGRQPMLSSDRSSWITFNGEIYNYLEIALELQAEGVKLSTQSDTEVALEAINKWGIEKCTHKFIGMYAIGLLNTRSNTLTLARDPFGIKPLFYARWSEGFAFSSELNPLLQLPGVDQSLQPEKTWHYLRFGVTDDGADTMLAGVHQIPAGSYSVLDLTAISYLQKLQPICFWSPISVAPYNQLSYEDAVHEVRDCFLESIKLHLRSDVPVGAALSGGVDSSAIVCAIRYLFPNQELHTFSYIPGNASISEEKWIDLVNAHTSSIPHKISPNEGDLISSLDDLFLTQEFPFGSTSIFAQNCVFKAAADAGIKVMLDGQGADELLAGYVPFQSSRMASLLSQFSIPDAFNFLSVQSDWDGRSRRQVLIEALGQLLPLRFRSIARLLVGKSDSPGWCNSNWFDNYGVDRNCPWHVSKDNNHLHSDLKESITTGLLSLLRYEDRNSMAFSIESRVPFLTVPLAELLLSLPEEYLISSDGESKHIFKDAMRGIVPDPILDRRDKIGFATPELDWLRSNTAFVDQSLDLISDVPCFNKDTVEYCKHMLNGSIPFSFQLWRILNFAQWYHSLNQV